MGYSLRNSIGVLFILGTCAWPQARLKEVRYEVDGTAKYADLTITNESGGKEQNRVKLPFEMKFIARAGQFLYLSAQKVQALRANIAETLLDR
jgi:hypothetical protein